MRDLEATRTDRSPDRPLAPAASVALDACARTARIEARLEALFPPAPEGDLSDLTEPLRAACLSRGKRVRPVLSMLSAAHFGAMEDLALDFGCALELVHTASLILDDLPCMDNASMRRGRPSFHRRFGEDAAVLSAIALLSRAFGLVAGDRRLNPDLRLSLHGLLTDTVGLGGLVSGQIRDLRDSPSSRDEAGLARLNHQKTGVMFIAAAVGGAMIAGASPEAQARARTFGASLGLAFQLLDDVHDRAATQESLGKDVRKDDNRVTFVSLWGLERARREARATLGRALGALGDPASPLACYAAGLFDSVAHAV